MRQRKVLHRFSDGEQMLKRMELSRWLGVAPNTIEAWVREGNFPKPVIMGDHTSPNAAVRWRKWEIDQWIDGRPRKKECEGPKRGDGDGGGYEDEDEDDDG